MHSAQTLVSVIIPAYNAEQTIQRTLVSVTSQSYKNMEIIIVDDGSTDGTADILAKLASSERRVTVFRQANEGVAAARNQGIIRAKGEYIAPLDADDIWHPTKIEKQVNLIEKNPRVGLVYAWYRVIDADDRVIETPAPILARGDCFTWLIVENFIGNASSALVRRSLLLQTGGYDTSLRAAGAQGAEDLRMQFNIAELARFEVVPEYLVGYRRRPDAMSTNYLSMVQSTYLVLTQVRQRFPSLPRRLFRWSESQTAAYFGMLHLRENMKEGLSLLVEAALRDPFVAWHLIAKPFYAAIRRKFVRLFRRIFPAFGWRRNERLSDRPVDRTCIGREFLDVNPTAISKFASVSWNHNRIKFARAYGIPSRPLDCIPTTQEETRGVIRR